MSIHRKAAIIGIVHLPSDQELEIGMPLEVVFEQVADDVTLPQWRPRHSGG